MRFWDSFKRAIRYNYLRVMRLKVSIHSVALGMAVGVFTGCLPVLPFQTVVALTLAFILRCSKVAAAAGTWVSNPLNWVPFYTACFIIGNWLIPIDVTFDPHHMELKELVEQGWGIVVVMMTGGLVMAIPCSVLSYFITFRAVTRFRKRRMIRLINQYKRRHGEQSTHDKTLDS
ncbi:DUF2062 domain-containing protein [Halodesulfovibrio marinisediminis]|uniref:DUF2062 domain-containing protein n=1 Tax=Halodesulfovibrio marinisediminis DSM 17456 TaxID=1121457 RepID=A0A1N6DY80_9BACT|nr:DUF2062 domain-containing protein [Halodesulfovibrio marinisediminis]SIN75701.1 hypothetical protein SAMN02745161_0570 [Halodesulfovibrio marinisediminis DSM 17456]